jgi:glycosyltransferase involved in cell wall biosynthesis
VLDQSHRALELLVVDDGSEDETTRELERFGDRITILSQRPAGVYAARNLGIRHAQGDFVAFIDSDDRWHSARLAAQLPLIRRAGIGLVFGDVTHVDCDGRADHRGARTSFQVTPPSRGRVVEHFASGNFVPTISVLARRSCLEEVGGFPTSHLLSADYLTWFRIAVRHQFDYVAEPVADYTVHRDGISADLGQALLARLELFSAELASTRDPFLRAVLERLVFNLGMHLALAAVRGRASSVPHVWRVVADAVAVAPAGAAVPSAGSFVARQAAAHLRRLST